MAIVPPISPNTLTTIRLPLAPLTVAALIYGSTGGFVLAAFLALLVELTDLADGWLARNYDAVSDFGKLFDPYADALSRFTLFLGLMAIDVADLWMILAIFYRDSTVAFLRSVAATQQIVLAARQSGKIKAVVQGVGTQICFLGLAIGSAFPEYNPLAHQTAWWTMLLITVITVLSLVDYIAGNLHIFRNALYPPDQS